MDNDPHKHPFTPTAPGGTRCRMCPYHARAHLESAEVAAPVKEEISGFAFEGTLPVYLNLSDTEGPVVGQAVGYRLTTGRTRIEITLDPSASSDLNDLVAVFQLKAIGFAGVKHDRGT